MKTLFYKIFCMALLAGTILSTFESCKIKNPTEGIAIYMKPDAVSAPNSFGFIDSKTGYTKSELEGFEVTITGPGSASLFTTDGYRTFKIVNGQIGVCVRRGVNPSPANPVKFDITFDKPGYLTKTTHVELTSLIPISQSIRVLNLSDLPKTVSKKDTTFTVGTGGLATPVIISTPSTDSLPSTSFTMPAGTKFVDENNVPFTGPLSITMLNSKSSGEDFGASPFGLVVPNLLDEKGTILTNTAFLPNNVYQLNISGGGKALKVLSADSNIKINPYEVPVENYIIDSYGTIKLVPVNDFIPKNSIITVAGNILKLSKANLNFTNKQFMGIYDYRLRYSSNFSVKREIGNISIKINRDGIIVPILNNLPKNMSNELVLKPKYKDAVIKEYSFNLTEGENNIEIPDPGEINYNFISKFSLKCSNDGSFVVLPEGWSIYLIPRETYFNSVVNGHRVQPADGTGDYIEGYTQTSVTEKDANGKDVIFNYVLIPLNALQENTEYIVCTYFGSKGLIFNDFNSTTGKLITPAGIQNATQDFVDTPKSMSVKCN